MTDRSPKQRGAIDHDRKDAFDIIVERQARVPSRVTAVGPTPAPSRSLHPNEDRLRGAIQSYLRQQDTPLDRAHAKLAVTTRNALPSSVDSDKSAIVETLLDELVPLINADPQLKGLVRSRLSAVFEDEAFPGRERWAGRERSGDPSAFIARVFEDELKTRTLRRAQVAQWDYRLIQAYEQWIRAHPEDRIDWITRPREVGDPKKNKDERLQEQRRAAQQRYRKRHIG